MARGLLITFSGLDGAGKSTQIDLLMDRLQREGLPPIYLWTRGGYTTFFERLKAGLRRFSGQALPPPGHSARRAEALGKVWVRRVWLTLALLDLLRVYGLQVRWWRGRGRAVVCDRYLWDTLVDLRLHYPQELVERWWLWRLLVWATPPPDAAFLIVVPVAESVRRSKVKDEPFQDPPELRAQRLNNYQVLGRELGWQVLDGQRPREVLADQVWASVAHCHPKLNSPVVPQPVAVETPDAR
jgi:dTMP kinase